MKPTLRRMLSLMTLVVAVVALAGSSAAASQYPPDLDDAGPGRTASERGRGRITVGAFDSAAAMLGLDSTAHPLRSLLEARTLTSVRASSLAARAAGRSAPVLEIDNQLFYDGDNIVIDLDPGAALELGICCTAPDQLVLFDLGRTTPAGIRSLDRSIDLGVALTTEDGAAVLDTVAPELEPGTYQLMARTSDGGSVTELSMVLQIGAPSEKGSGVAMPAIAAILVVIGIGLLVGGRRRAALTAG